MDTQPTVQIVVAHYNEDLSWLEPVKDSCIVYSKGGAKNAPTDYPYISLPNIGREGHTYLHHIVKRYHQLADVTIFLQGRIDDHVNLSPAEIKERALSTRPGEVVTFPFRELELFDLWDGIPWEKYPCWEKWANMDCKKMPKSPAQYFRQYFGNGKVPESIGFQPGAIFAVHKETIQQHSRLFYRSLLQELFLGDMAHVNPETGHYMERFWLAMWNPSEYVCWNSEDDLAMTKRNSLNQLAKGHWHRTPRGVKVDASTIYMSKQS
ncbi:MAG: hypothetical protein M1824_004359 [Vezdaea acicularis]|nr:MAG: hypothetical protein M1824_004359 [Vezdaea acicularis]